MGVVSKKKLDKGLLHHFSNPTGSRGMEIERRSAFGQVYRNQKLLQRKGESSIQDRVVRARPLECRVQMG